MSADVAIIGAGPAGLTAATYLVRSTLLNVVVLERESEPGGIPRHSDHLGYGIRDLKTFITGPAYARRLAAEALRVGVTIRTDTMVTGWAGDTTLELTSPRGREQLEARAVILATGARERPRAARLIPGDRGAGVYTTGHLQNVVHLKHGSVGRRAVVVGAELVSYSAVLTLRQAGCAAALMTTGVLSGIQPRRPHPTARCAHRNPNPAVPHHRHATRHRCGDREPRHRSARDHRV